MITARSSLCTGCGHRVSFLNEVRWEGRAFCSRRCAGHTRDAAYKARQDRHDPNPTICRCPGPPQPLEPSGPHCSQCRRMFSAGVRIWLAQRSGPQRYWGLSEMMRWLSVRLTATAPRGIANR